jgi:hypothetical protein
MKLNIILFSITIILYSTCSIYAKLVTNIQSGRNPIIKNSLLISGGAKKIKTKEKDNGEFLDRIKLKSKSTLIQSILNYIKRVIKRMFSNKKSIHKKEKMNEGNISTGIKPSIQNRIQKEIKSFIENPPINCELIVGSNIRSWIVKITGLDGTIYAGEKFKLKMVFPKDYPSKRKLLIIKFIL